MLKLLLLLLQIHPTNEQSKWLANAAATVQDSTGKCACLLTDALETSNTHTISMCDSRKEHSRPKSVRHRTAAAVHAAACATPATAISQLYSFA
jgi:hypothetical protein